MGAKRTVPHTFYMYMTCVWCVWVYAPEKKKCLQGMRHRKWARKMWVCREKIRYKKNADDNPGIADVADAQHLTSDIVTHKVRKSQK